jgi:hypothetical protein
MNDAVDRRPLRERMLILAATVAAFVLFAWVAAHWIWRWASPPTPRASVPAPADPAATILASGLWAGGSDAPAAAATSAPTDLRLIGVLAERDGKGVAVFRTRDGTRVVTAGSEIAPGVKLESVDAWSVRVTDASGGRTIELKRDAAPSPSTPARAPAAGVAPKVGVVTPRATTPACAVPNGFSGPVLKLHAELLDGLIAQPDSWRAMLAADNGQLVVREDGGFATMLGLAKGDRLVQANGIALQQPDDVTGAVLRPLAQSQPVRVVGSRAGQAREVLIQNATACP